MSKSFLFVSLALAAPAAVAAGQSGTPPATVEIVAKRDAEWASYRHAYKAAAKFASLTRSRPLIQAHMQIVPRRQGLPLDGLRIELAGETVRLDIAVDAIGRATLPMLKQAFDEDAVLRLNRQKDNYRFTGRYSIREKEDGVYNAAELRAACEQMIAAQREWGNLLRLMGKKCVGVRFVYPLASVGAVLTLRDAAGNSAAIPAATAAPFDPVPMGAYKVVAYRFDAWPATGELVASQRPLLITTTYE